ncbi:hypothetical protein BOO34_14575 [Vibrio navarrensis]|nr:hypothetical protein [Vibrio navarrensis]
MSPEEFNEFFTDMAMLAGPFTIARAAKLASPIANTMYSRYTGKVVGIGEDVTKSVDLNLKYKKGWTAAQKAAADAKCQALCDANTVVTQSQRSGTSAASRYKRAGNSVPSGNDVDHVHDLQLGGSDTLSNMSPLDSSVNRSLGSQIHHQIKNLPLGTVIDKVNIN